LNVEDEIRKMYISENVSEVSAIPEVRKYMVGLQKKMGKKRGIVMDGRDIGTEVFPDAELKIFMVADMMVRASRRQLELLEKKQVVSLDDILENIQKRDIIDTTRAEGPLRKAEDAFILDSTFITIEEQVDFIINLAIGKMIDAHKVLFV
jgi:CMP/dCMP kinase